MKLKKTIKVIISLTLAMIMFSSLTISAFATQKEDLSVQPRWTSIFTMDVDMVFVDGRGTAAASARKQSTASHIEGMLYVYKWTGSSWEYVGHDEGSKTVGTLGLNVYFVGEQNVQYRAVFTVFAFTNGISETETIECLKTCR